MTVANLCRRYEFLFQGSFFEELSIYSIQYNNQSHKVRGVTWHTHCSRCPGHVAMSGAVSFRSRSSKHRSSSLGSPLVSSHPALSEKWMMIASNLSF